MGALKNMQSIEFQQYKSEKCEKYGWALPEWEETVNTTTVSDAQRIWTEILRTQFSSQCPARFKKWLKLNVVIVPLD